MNWGPAEDLHVAHRLPPQRPPVERYIRCSVTRGDWIVEPGLEWREGDNFEALTGDLAVIARHLADFAAIRDPMHAALRGEIGIAERWPGRAFFIEVHDAKCERWTQIYQPYITKP